jgi:hypothetical protein
VFTFDVIFFEKEGRGGPGDKEDAEAGKVVMGEVVIRSVFKSNKEKEGSEEEENVEEEDDEGAA